MTNAEIAKILGSVETKPKTKPNKWIRFFVSVIYYVAVSAALYFSYEGSETAMNWLAILATITTIILWVFAVLIVIGMIINTEGMKKELGPVKFSTIFYRVVGAGFTFAVANVLINAHTVLVGFLIVGWVVVQSLNYAIYAEKKKMPLE